MMNMETMIWRASWVPEKARVIIARATKLDPPAKSKKFSEAIWTDTGARTSKLVEFEVESYGEEE
jgi:hypothetical protein